MGMIFVFVATLARPVEAKTQKYRGYPPDPPYEVNHSDMRSNDTKAEHDFLVVYLLARFTHTFHGQVGS